MPAVLRIRNGDNIVIISQGTLNFSLRAKGTVTCTTLRNTGGIDYYETTITFTGAEFPMLALACVDKVAHIFTSVSGTTWTFTIISLTSGASVNYWIFDKAAAPPPYASGDVKFELRTDAGDLAFWLGAKPLRVVGIGSATYASGRVYAVIQTAPGWGFTETNPGGMNRFYRAFYGASRVNSNVVVAGAGAAGPGGPGILFESYTEFGVGPFTPQSYTPPAYQFLVVDVTHL